MRRTAWDERASTPEVGIRNQLQTHRPALLGDRQGRSGRCKGRAANETAALDASSISSRHFFHRLPGTTPERAVALASCSHPDCATMRLSTTPTRRQLLLQGAREEAPAPRETRNARRVACQRELQLDAAVNGPRLSRERRHLADPLAASARTTGRLDETRHGRTRITLACS
jgi:hypothetical protein